MSAAAVVILMSSVHNQSSSAMTEKVDPIIVMIALVVCIAMGVVIYWSNKNE